MGVPLVDKLQDSHSENAERPIRAIKPDAPNLIAGDLTDGHVRSSGMQTNNVSNSS
jgi:hypothetical protein